MINKINSVSTNPVQYRTSFKSEAPATKPEENVKQEVNLTGVEALAVYNAPLLKHPEKLDVEPLEPVIIMPEDFDSIEGEKIYTSEGKLHSVIKEDENTKTVYIPDEENEKMFSMIMTTDKKTGNLIREQKNFVKDGKYEEIYINEYSPETGKEIADTCYLDGEVKRASKTIYKPNKEVVIVSKDFNDNDYTVSKYSENHNNSIYVTFDKNKQLKGVNEFKNNGLKHTDFYANFYNGGMISISKTEETTIPNNYGADKLNNPDLVPSESYKLDFDAKGLDGEKTYYSNGAIETNSFERNGEKVKAYFVPDGNLEKLELADKTVKFDGENQRIEESLEDNRVKITTLYDDGSKDVRIENGKEFKEADFNKTGKPESYEEGSIDENGEDNNTLSLYFNKMGMLESAYSC